MIKYIFILSVAAIVLGCSKDEPHDTTGDINGGERQIDIVKTGGKRVYINLHSLDWFKNQNKKSIFLSPKLHISITDKHGTLIEKVLVIPDTQNLHYQLPTLPKGEYIVTVVNDSTTQTQTIIID